MKNDFWKDDELEEPRTIVSSFIYGIGVILLLVVILGGIIFGYKMFAVNANREIFKHSTAYIEAAADFLAKSYWEYNQADTEQDKVAIMDYVIKRYPNLDFDEIENYDLENFYRQCLRGGGQ